MLPIRAVEDHHVDRPGVEAQQCVKLTGTNSSIGFIALIIPVHPNKDEQDTTSRSGPQSRQRPFVTAQLSHKENRALALRRPGGHGGEKCTRSHPELGRETPQRQWYSVLRRGRVGRCQACKVQDITTNTNHTNNPLHKHKQNTKQPSEREISGGIFVLMPNKAQ